jgi:hypothetical protein
VRGVVEEEVEVFFFSLLRAHRPKKKKKLLSSHLRHREHVRDADGVVVDELSQHETHDLHGHSGAAWAVIGERSKREG